jgi:omega-amidase
MKSELRVALGQMDLAWGNPPENLKKVEEWTAIAAQRGADVIVFPELWSTGYDLAHAAEYASPLDEGIFAATANLARHYGIAIVGSCLAQSGAGQVGNTAVYTDASGLIRGAYSKAHLFRLMHEEQYLTAGDRLTLVDAGWGLAGLGICYDLRFPEFLRAYALAGATAVFLPAEWPHPRCEHWRTLLRARAIENQMFVIACNRVGRDPNNLFCGHSCIIDPAGVTLVEGHEEPALLFADLDLSQVAQTRARIPVFDDRRPDLYAPPAEPASSS